MCCGLCLYNWPQGDLVPDFMKLITKGLFENKEVLIAKEFLETLNLFLNKGSVVRPF